ncbi:hypothetical protein AC1031_003598 [Aphanomyces cochlioides]|nr:hypothetical protein AC1031_003598 [Aphanomyces cochlioides]
MWQSYVDAVIIVIVVAAGFWSIRRFPPPTNEFMTPRTSSFNFLLIFRSLIVIANLVSLIGYSGLPRAFRYYTLWNFILQTIYYILMLSYQLRHRNESKEVPTDTEFRALNTLFDICISVSFLVCLVFWAVVHPTSPGQVITLNLVYQHGINCVLLIIELAFNGFVVRGSTFGYTLLFPALYGILSWIGHETWLNGVWPYKFLDISSPASPGWYIGVVLVHPIFLWVAIQLSKLKRRCRPQFCPRSHEEALASVITPKDSAV